jgi:hypothetical protein
MMRADDTPRRRADALAEQLGVDHRGRLPKDIGRELAEQLFDAALRDDNDAQLLKIAGETRFQDGYSRRFVRDWDFSELRKLVREGRWRLGSIDRQIADLQRVREELEAIMQPTAATSAEDDASSTRRKSDEHNRT